MEHKKQLMRDLCDTIMLNYAPDTMDMTIEDEIADFRNELTPELRKKFNRLLDRSNADDCEYAYAAFEYGFHTIEKLR